MSWLLYASKALATRAHVSLHGSHVDDAFCSLRLLFGHTPYTSLCRRSCLTPSNTVWKTTAHHVEIFLGSPLHGYMVPFHQHLWYSMITFLHEMAIQHLFRDEVGDTQIMNCRKFRERRLLIRSERFQLRNVKDRVNQAMST